MTPSSTMAATTSDPAAARIMSELAATFGALRGGVIVAASSHHVGVVNLVVENKPVLGRISDSWQRLVMTLRGCDAFAYDAAKGSTHLSDPKSIGARALRIRDITEQAGRILIHCETPIESGILHLHARTFTLMLGSGRTINTETLLNLNPTNCAA